MNGILNQEKVNWTMMSDLDPALYRGARDEESGYGGGGGGGGSKGEEKGGNPTQLVTYSQPGHDRRLGDFLRHLKCSGYKKVR